MPKLHQLRFDARQGRVGSRFAIRPSLHGNQKQRQPAGLSEPAAIPIVKTLVEQMQKEPFEGLRLLGRQLPDARASIGGGRLEHRKVQLFAEREVDHPKLWPLLLQTPAAMLNPTVIEAKSVR